MFWRKRKASAPPVPYRWTQDLWTEAFLSGGQRFHGLVLITALHKRHEFCEDRPDPSFQTKIEYFGRLTREPGSSINHIGVTLSFDTQHVSFEWASIPDSAAGFASTQEWQEHYKTACYLGVTVRATAASSLEFETTFHPAKANGQDFVPLRLSSERPVPPIDNDGFACVQPLSSVAFQQKVSLVGRINQDE